MEVSTCCISPNLKDILAASPSTLDYHHRALPKSTRVQPYLKVVGPSVRMYVTLGANFPITESLQGGLDMTQ